MEIIKYPLGIQLKIWLSLWIISLILLTPVLVILIRFFNWPAWPGPLKAAVISLPMVIIMPALGEWLTRKFAGQQN